jgi:organic radical activating enzyme
MKNLDPIKRVETKQYEMNLPMTGNPEEDNITILDNMPPIFHNAPVYDLDENPFSFIYIDTNYKCNMECGFCDTPVRHYKDLEIDAFEELCAKLPYKVAMRFVGGEPTLWSKMFKALEIAEKYKHQVAVVTNGIKLANKTYAKELYNVWKNNPSFNISVSLNGGLYNDEWYEKIDHDKSWRKQKVKGLQNIIELGFKKICTNAIIVKGLNEGVVKQFYDLATSLPSGTITNIRYRCAAKQGRYVDDLIEKEDHTSYTGIELNEYVKTIIPEANNPLRWIRDGIHPSTGSGKRLNNPKLKCNSCCLMYYIKPKLWVATVEFGSHNSALCWRRGQFVQSIMKIQPAHHYIDELSRYVNTYVPDGMKQLSDHMMKEKTENVI